MWYPDVEVYRQNQNLHRSAPFWAWVKGKTLKRQRGKKQSSYNTEKCSEKDIIKKKKKPSRHHIYLKRTEILQYENVVVKYIKVH